MNLHAPAVAAIPAATLAQPALPLRIRGLSKRYGDVAALADVALEIRAGEFFALLGPSGCGKTTLLRSVAGIVQIDEGEILLGHDDISIRPIYARDTALVFQNYALFPHLNVYENVAFGLKMRKRAAAEVKARVMEALELVRMTDLVHRLPRELSGGQQQRVALARAMVVRPAVLLLDEPLSNLDARLRDEMRAEIRRLQKTLGVTTILVTHDIEEALAVADRLAIMRQGRVEQIGTSSSIYEAPRSRFVAEFVGHTNVLAGTVCDSAAGRMRIDLSCGLSITAAGRGVHRPGEVVWVVVPAERVRLGPAVGRAENRCTARIEDVTYLGSFRQVTFDIGGARLLAKMQNVAGSELAAGEQVVVGWDGDDAITVPFETAAASAR